MSDNTTLNTGSGGDVIATDDIGGVKHQLVKTEWGPADTANQVDDATGKRLPVKVGEALPTGTNNIGDVDVLTMPDVTVVGKAADGAAVSGNPILIAGQDGTNTQSIKTDAAGELQVDVLTVPDVTVVGKAADGAAVSGNPVLIAGQDGTNAQSIKTDAAGELQVDVLTMPTTTVQGTVTAVGDVAHDGGDSGNPQKIGGRAISDLAGATMVAAADRTDFVADLSGAQIVQPYCPLGNILSERVSDTGGTSTAFSTFNAVASSRNHVTTIIAYNDSTTNGFLDIRDGTGGSVLATIPLPAKGGAIVNFPVPLRQPTANTALAFDVNAALTTVYITIVGFKSKA